MAIRSGLLTLALVASLPAQANVPDPYGDDAKVRACAQEYRVAAQIALELVRDGYDWATVRYQAWEDSQNIYLLQIIDNAYQKPVSQSDDYWVGSAIHICAAYNWPTGD